jgi:ATP-dependent Clp protease protease subunit
MAAIVNGNEIVLSGVVGGDADPEGFFMMEGFSSSDVISALAEVGRDTNIVIRLNSPGGIATEGAAIHAALSQHKGTVQVVVEGIAASAASLLAMAADTVMMSPGAVMMIHDTAGFTFGTAADHAKSMEGLNTLSTAYAEVYADKSGKKPDECRAIMREESWFTPSEAVAAGFADGVGAANDNESEPEPVAFDYRLFAKAPERLVALASARGWRARASLVAPAAPTRPKETSMSDTPAGDAPATEIIEPVVAPVAEAAPPAPPAPEASPAPDAGAVAEVLAPLMACGMTQEAATAFVREGGTLERAQARAAEIGEMRALAGKAGKDGAFTALVDAHVAEGKNLADFRSALLDKMVDKQSPEIAPHTAADTKLTADWKKFTSKVSTAKKVA